MKFFVKKTWLFLGLVLIPIVAYASTSIIRQPNLRLGRGVAENITLEFDEGSGVNRPKLRWNESGGRVEIANDGSTFNGVVSAAGAFTQYGIVYGDGTETLQITGAGSAGQVLARPVAGGNPAYVNEVGALKVSGFSNGVSNIDNTDSPYSLSALEDIVFVNASAGAVTLELPAASGVEGKSFKVIRTDNTLANAVTLDPASSELIDGQSTLVLQVSGDSVTIVSSGTGWFITGQTRSNAGEIFQWGTSTCPSGALDADGTAVSRGTYARLFARIGTTAGVGDGVNTFNVPNGNGVVLRGTSTQSISGRTKTGPSLLAQQEDQFQGHWHNMQVGTDIAGLNASPNWSPGYNTMLNGPYNLNNGPRAPTSDGSNGTPRVGAETRAAAIGVKHCIWF